MSVQENSRVPVGLVEPLIRRFLDTHDPGMGYPTLAEKTDSTEDFIVKILCGSVQTVSFDFADRLVCYTVGPDFWQTPEVRDFYMGLTLLEQCEGPGCSKYFKSRCGSGKSRRLYCSPDCERRAKNKRIMERRGRPQKVVSVRSRHGRAEECARGHRFTKENTIQKKNGTRQCRTCFNEANRRSYHERKQRAA